MGVVESSDVLELGGGDVGVFVVVDDFDILVVIVYDGGGVEEVVVVLFFDEQAFVVQVVGVILDLVVN